MGVPKPTVDPVTPRVSTQVKLTTEQGAVVPMPIFPVVDQGVFEAKAGNVSNKPPAVVMS